MVLRDKPHIKRRPGYWTIDSPKGTTWYTYYMRDAYLIAKHCWEYR